MEKYIDDELRMMKLFSTSDTNVIS